MRMRSMLRPQSGCILRTNHILHNVVCAKEKKQSGFILAIETAGVLQGRLAVLTVVVSSSGVDRSYPLHELGIMAIRANLLNKTI